ncbi:MAG: hypothetical protein ACO3RX_01600 [Chthoniobacterales bacterium]
MTDDSWKHEPSRWIAFKTRAFDSGTIYWGPFSTYAELEEWANRNEIAVSVVELKDPNSDPADWWR